jgi:mRNA-degrading endonuclease YafQ of YafQ-DinJ toxin-antitoxin module
LSGSLKDLWSFSLNFNFRVVFIFTTDKPAKAILVDIGTHDEVY